MSAPAKSTVVGGQSPVPRLHGLDVSNFQGQMNWQAVHDAGFTFAAIKATEGLEFRDPTLPHNWLAAGYFGFIRLAYTFLRPEFGGAAQADVLHQYVHDHGRFRPGDGVLLDLEVSDGLTPARVLESAEEFVTRCRQQIGKQVVLYTAPFFWDALNDPISPVLASCPLWIADYGVITPPRLANLPSPAFWQYSSTGLVPGVAGQVDLDLFFGGKQQLQKLLQYHP